MDNHLLDKRIIITGAASGFGRLVSEKAAALGAKVVAADVDLSGLETLSELARDQGWTLIQRQTDVTQIEDMQSLVATSVSEWGGVDVLVNNAGVMPLAFYSDHTQALAAWDRCIDVNIKGVLNGMVAVHDTMLAQGRGHIVNLSSIYGNFPVVGAGVYGASKAAVNFLSESLRVETQGKIKVTLVKPTGVPATGLGAGIVNEQAIVGILGQNAPAYLQQMQGLAAGSLPAAQTDADSIEYFALAPEQLAQQIIYAINQPWGVSIGDITVRASGDGYIL